MPRLQASTAHFTPKQRFIDYFSSAVIPCAGPVDYRARYRHAYATARSYISGRRAAFSSFAERVEALMASFEDGRYR